MTANPLSALPAAALVRGKGNFRFSSVTLMSLVGLCRFQRRRIKGWWLLPTAVLISFPSPLISPCVAQGRAANDKAQMADQRSWEDVQGVWFGSVTYITISHGVRRAGPTVNALLVIGPEGKFLTVSRTLGREATAEYYRLAPPHKVLNNTRELCRLERVDADGKPLPDSTTGMVVGIMRPQSNRWKEYAQIFFNDQGGDGLQMGSGKFIRPIERPFRPARFDEHQLFSAFYGNDRPGTRPETRAAGIAALKKLFQTFKKQGFDFVHTGEIVLSRNEVANLKVKTGPIERSVFLIYCKGDAAGLFVQAWQGPGGKYVLLKGEFPMFLVVPHKWLSMPLTEEFQIWNAGTNDNLTHPAKFGGGSNVEVTIFQFSNSFARSPLKYDFGKLR